MEHTFLTICVQHYQYLFGNIDNEKMYLSDAGKMIQTVWCDMPNYYAGVDIDEFIVMPNHIHGIVTITDTNCAARSVVGQPQGAAPTKLSLSDVVHRFKTMTTKRYADAVKQQGWPPFPGKLWQRNYWEHVVRNETDLLRIREYIHNNPTQWVLDKHSTAPKPYE